MNFEQFKLNEKYNNGSMGVKTKPIIFKDVFTYGVQINKFNKDKFTTTLCLNPEQHKEINEIEKKCFDELSKQGVSVNIIKSCENKGNMYIKVDPEEFSTFKENGDEICFKDVLNLKNLKVDVAVEIKSVFVSKGVGHLQVYLYELVVLDSKKEKPKEKRVRVL